MEEWRDIEGFDGYQVSSEGRVRSFWRMVHYKDRPGCHSVLTDDPFILSQSDDGKGYRHVMLLDRKNGVYKCRRVHRLVAEAFLQKNNDDDVVDHIQSGYESRSNNSVSNLQWVTQKYNVQKSFRDGMHAEELKRRRKCIRVLDTWTGEEAYFRSVSEAASFYGVSQPALSDSALDRKGLVAERYDAKFVTPEEVFLYESASYWDDEDY